VAREQYVRPPTVALEPPSARLAAWRYRLVAALMLLLALAFFSWLFLKVSGVTGGEDPGITGGLGQPSSGTLSTAFVPRG
jgi:hypothetical protein